MERETLTAAMPGPGTPLHDLTNVLPLVYMGDTSTFARGDLAVHNGCVRLGHEMEPMYFEPEPLIEMKGCSSI